MEAYLSLPDGVYIEEGHQLQKVVNPPTQYTHTVEDWDCETKEACFQLLEKFSKQGWELITIANGLAYFSRINLEYLAYLEAQNKREMSKKAKRQVDKDFIRGFSR